jgi:peroxiredoxin
MRQFLLNLTQILNVVGMKKIIFVLLFIVVLASCNRKNRFHIEGQIKGAGDTTVYFNEMSVSESMAIDSTETNAQGKFSFKGETEYPRFYQVALSSNNFINLLIKPGEEIKLTAESDNLTHYTIEGSSGSQKVKLLDQRLRLTKHKLDSLTGLYKNMEGLNASEEKLEKINEEYRRVLNDQRDSSIAFILDNMSSLASIMALYQKVNPQTFVLYKNSDLQYIKLVSDSLKQKYPESKHVKALLANRDDLMKRYENLRINKQLEEASDKVNYSTIPEIKLPNLRGDSVSLNSIDAPMILLSFWSSKNQESIQRNIELKKIYNQYHKKGFEIYQVSLDTDLTEWRKAVNFDQLPWIQVSSLDGVNTYAARVYNVSSLPTDYLINKNREIVARNPEIHELKRKLSIALD